MVSSVSVDRDSELTLDGPRTLIPQLLCLLQLFFIQMEMSSHHDEDISDPGSLHDPEIHTSTAQVTSTPPTPPPPAAAAASSPAPHEFMQFVQQMVQQQAFQAAAAEDRR